MDDRYEIDELPELPPLQSTFSGMMIRAISAYLEEENHETV